MNLIQTVAVKKMTQEETTLTNILAADSQELVISKGIANSREI